MRAAAAAPPRQDFLGNTVANTRSARKRIRSSETKRIRNRTVKSAVRTKVARARRAILGQVETESAEVDVQAAIRALDRAAEKGILHKNNARRRKSRLAAMSAKVQAAARGEEGDQAAARSAAAGGAKGRTAKGAARKTAAKPAAKDTTKPKAAAKTPAKAAKPATKGTRSRS
jgi:small subunit ribosomal protein S20